MSDSPHSPARDGGADLLKAAAIFGVVFIHTPGSGAGSVDEVFRFCVPVFIALWAYYFESGLARRPAHQHARYARDKFVRLLIPFLFWTAVYVPLRHPPAGWGSAPPSLHLDWWTGNGWPGQYFFVVLFQLLPLVLLARRAVGPRLVWGVVLAGPVGFAVAETVLWDYPAVRGVGERAFVYWLPYAAVGVGLARGYVPRLPAAALACAAAALALAPAEFRALERDHPNPSRMILVAVYVGSLGLLLALGPRPSRPPAGESGGWVDRAIGAVGRNTFPVYVLNVLVLAAVETAFVRLAPTAGPAGAAARAALAVFTIAAALGIAWVLRRAGLGVLVGG